MQKRMIIIFPLILASLCAMASEPDVEGVTGRRMPSLSPDYSGVTFPPNIAPPNFRIREAGKAYRVRIHGDAGPNIRISQKSPQIAIPASAWKKLAEGCAGTDVFFEIELRKDSGEWTRFAPVVNHIAAEPIDPYLAYRLIDPAYNMWYRMGIYQRNLGNYKETPIVTNRTTNHSCMNCHNFCMNNPDRMVMHMRGGEANGTLIVRDGRIQKVNTSTDFNKAGAYQSWHPDGSRIAFSVNTLTLFMHATGEPRDVLDAKSDLIVYDIDSNRITTSPLIASPDRMENFPCWSPDGKFLYFTSAPKFEQFLNGSGGEEDLRYDEIPYDLMRVSFDAATGAWGGLETLVKSGEGESLSMPRVSPDGRWLLFCKAAYGNFPVYLKTSDLYLLDLETLQVSKPVVNSDEAETFHSWSSNSRWFVFSSKRLDGTCARPFFSYLDAEGKAHKPFVLPQKDPDYYDTFIKTYNVPELAKGPVPESPWSLSRAAMNNKRKINAALDPALKPASKEKPAEDKLYQQAPR